MTTPTTRDVLLAYGNGWHGADCAGNFSVSAECSCGLATWLVKAEAEAAAAALADAAAKVREEPHDYKCIREGEHGDRRYKCNCWHETVLAILEPPK